MLQEEFEALTEDSGAAAGGGAPAGRMTGRERFVRHMHFQTVDRVPHMEFGYWPEIAARWHRQGLPAHLGSAKSKANFHTEIENYFGCEHVVYRGGKMSYLNLRRTEVVEEREHSVVVRDELGILKENVKDGPNTIPHFLEFPVRDRASWEAFRDEFLPLALDERVPKDIAAIGAAVLRKKEPIGVTLGSYLGYVRNWVGFENIALMFYDDPDLIEEMVAHLASIYHGVLSRVLPHVSADVAAGWEDICFNSGPICSPEMFARIVIPHMRPVLRLLRQHGVDVIWTDCDGDVTKLVPLWLEAGLNCMFPVEVNAGSDPVRLREEFGRDLLLVGGFDKMALLKGRKGILAELRRIAPVVEEGGFIPHVDHRVQADVPYEDYRYYIREKLAMLGWKPEEIAEVEGLKGM